MFYWLPLLLASLAFVQICHGRAIYVSNQGADSSTCGADAAHSCKTLLQAVQNAANGDSILFAAGQTFTCASSAITLARSLSFDVFDSGVRPPASRAIVDCNNQGTAFSFINANVSIANLVFVHSNDANKHGTLLILNAPVVSVRNCVFDRTVGNFLFMTSNVTSRVSISHTRFTNNRVKSTGVYQDAAVNVLLLAAHSSFDMDHCFFTNNSADYIDCGDMKLQLAGNNSTLRIQDSVLHQVPLSGLGANAAGQLLIVDGLHSRLILRRNVFAYHSARLTIQTYEERPRGSILIDISDCTFRSAPKRCAYL